MVAIATMDNVRALHHLPATVHHVLWINITHKKEKKGIRYTFLLCWLMLCSSAFYDKP